MYLEKYARAILRRRGLSSAILVAAAILIADVSFFSASLARCSEAGGGVCPYRDPSPRGNGGGSSGGGSSNNAAAIGAAGAALGILGTIIENSERQQEQSQERENRAARARWAYCENYVRQARAAVDRGNFYYDRDDYNNAIGHFNRAIALLGHCENRKNIALVRKNIQNARDRQEYSRRQSEYANDPINIEKVARERERRIEEAARERERIRQDEALQGYSKFFGSNDNYWRGQNGPAPLSTLPGQSSFSTDQTTPLVNVHTRLKREEELKVLRERLHAIEQMPPGPQKEALLKEVNEKWRIDNKDGKTAAAANTAGPSGSLGPRTCAIVNGIWTCGNNYNFPALVNPTDVRAKTPEPESPPLLPRSASDERLQGIPNGNLDGPSTNTRPIIIPESEVKTVADEMRNELKQK